MAKVYPEDREPEHDSERRVLDALRGLDGDWHVFHNIKWQGLRRDRQGDGETDFALFHPTLGITVIEAKGGEIALDDGEFVRLLPDGRRKAITNPFDQAAACKRQLREFLCGSVDGLDRIPRVGHAVAFPHGRVDADLGPQGPREIIIDADDLSDITGAVERVAKHWDPPTRLDHDQLASIRRLLLPSVRVRRLLADHIADASRAIIELTEEQYEVLDGLGENRQALITGGAGTGKTVLATERVRRLADLGEDARVLFVCFNRPLGDALAAEFDGNPNVIAGNFHRLVRNTLAEAELPFPKPVTPEWWAHDAISQFPDAAAKLGFEVDAVVVDEGQDFRPIWWDALQMVMRDPDDGWFYVFADAQQAVYVDDWSPPFDGRVTRWTLSKNCRNTDEIAAKVGGLFGGAVKALGVSGPKPKFHTVKNRDALAARLASRVRELFDEGLGADQIQVLSSSRRLIDELQSALVDDAARGQSDQRVGVVPGASDDETAAGGVAMETIQRFKGLEAPVVLVVLAGDLDDDDLALAYTGFSWATTMLEVFGTAATMRTVHWDTPQHA
ncbi:MAG TPA: NERD domain-containing protein [Acidimicrobiales bacterium]|nr:NERD domain-containing protein [Acidimicrobiales bacterium]